MGKATPLPQRMNQLSEADIIGRPSRDPDDALRAAYSHLEALHRAPCGGQNVSVLWKRMPTHGVSNDLNSIVRAFAIATAGRPQLVLLPPPFAARRALPLSRVLDAMHPWHWLDESVPLSSMLYLPSCQIQFQRDAAEELDQLGADASNASRAALSMKGVAKFVERSRDYDLGNRWYIELSVNKHIPKLFRSRGMLWWFQVLTTFLVRVRDPIAPRLRESAALQTLMHRVGGNESGGVSLLDSSTSQDRGFDAVWKALPLDPHLHFDLGLHVRMGDACGWKSARREIMRHCVANLSDALTRIGPVNGGVVDRRRRRRPARATSLFIASDSQAILDEARQVHDARISHVHTLEFQRDRYETGAAVEAVLSRENNTALEEALLDLLVLSQARVLAGAMLSNMPRLALQMRVRPSGKRPPYISLDGNSWCTTSSCKAALPAYVAEGLVKYYGLVAGGGAKGRNIYRS